MSPRNAQTSAEMRQASRARLVDGALEVFAERGFAAASMAQIARKCGVSKGLAYHYFESKEALLAAALRRHLETLLALTRSIDQEADAAKRLAMLIDGLIGYAQGEPAAFRLYLGLMLQTPSATLEHSIETLREPLDAYLDDMQRLFLELGAADPETDVALFRSALLGVCLRIALGNEQLPTGALRARLLQAFAGGGASETELRR